MLTAPELNPVEYLWGYWKKRELPNFCPRDFGQLSYQARRALRRRLGQVRWVLEKPERDFLAAALMAGA